MSILSTPMVWPTVINATDRSEIWKTPHFYAGLQYGFGCTDWSELVADPANLSQLDYSILVLSAPTSAGDQGVAYGFTVGYEIQPQFGVEINYLRFPNTLVQFDSSSLYTSTYAIVRIKSSTYAYNLLGKFMATIGHTSVRGFATAGPALVHRHDSLTVSQHICPTFGVGLNGVVSKRLMLELAFQYYAGYGKAVLVPAVNYIPFLYAVTLKTIFLF